MKLTKDDFVMDGNPPKHLMIPINQEQSADSIRRKLLKVKEQILKNQEDAEKYRKLPKMVTIQGRYNEKYIESEKIVERLKKRIEENKKTGAVVMLGTSEWSLEEELQKILGEEK